MKHHHSSPPRGDGCGLASPQFLPRLATSSHCAERLTVRERVTHRANERLLLRGLVHGAQRFSFRCTALWLAPVQILIDRGLHLFSKNEFVGAQESFRKAAEAVAAESEPPDHTDGETLGISVFVCPAGNRLSRTPPDRPRPRDRAPPSPHRSLQCPRRKKGRRNQSRRAGGVERRPPEDGLLAYHCLCFLIAMNGNIARPQATKRSDNSSALWALM